MSAFTAALAGAVTTVGVGAVMVARSWPGPGDGRHRAPRLAERIAARLHPTTAPREEAK